MQILVTGANGFLGSWVVKRLLAEGHKVRILARKSSDLSELAGLSYEISYGDVTDKDSVSSAVKGQDVVFHLAGLVAYKKEDRQKMENVNVMGTRHVLEAMVKQNVRDLVYASSVVAIGGLLEPNDPLDENATYNLSPFDLGYFETKHKAENLVLEWNRQGLGRAFIFNPSTIYGPGDAKKGSRKTQVKVAQGKFPFYTQGGVNVIAIQDCVEGIMRVWTRGRPGERYILAGENITIKALFGWIAEFSGVPAPRFFLPGWVVFALGFMGDALARFGKSGPISSETARTSQMYHWFDSSKAQKELGLQIRPAKEAIRESVDWMKANGWTR